MKSRRASSVSRFFRRNGASEKADIPTQQMRAPRATTRVLECQPDERELLRTSIIPTVVQYLGKNGLHLEDLFLKDPSASTQEAMMGLTSANQREPVRALRELLDARYSGDEASVLSAHHPYVWAISIKVALKELSKPLVPSNVAISLIDAETHDSASGKADYLKRAFVPGCPDVVQDLFHLLYACRSPKDKLGFMMAALLFLSVQSGQDEADFGRLSANVELLSKATQFLVSNAEMVFGPSPFEVQAAPQISKAAPPPPPPPGRPQFAAATSTFDAEYDEDDSGLPPTPSFPSVASNGSGNDEKALFRAICIYDFDPESPDELELRVGDVITVLEIAEDDWYRGRLVLPDGTVEEGVFPANYVRKDETEKPPAPSPSKPPAVLPPSGGKAQAPPPPPPPAIPVFKPEFEEDEEDDNVDQTRAQMEAASLSAFSTSLAVPPPAPPPKQESSSTASSQPLKTPQGIPAVALFDFEPMEPGELELQKGEELLVLDRTDPEWWLAKRVRDGEQGLFPFNYAKLVDGPRQAQQQLLPVPAIAPKAPAPLPPQTQQPKPVAPPPPPAVPSLQSHSSSSTGNGVNASTGSGTGKAPLQRASSSRGGARPPPPPPPPGVSLPAAGAAVVRQPAPMPPTTAAQAPIPIRQSAPVPSTINTAPSLMQASSTMGTGVNGPSPMASQLNMPGVPSLASTMQRPTMGMPPITAPAPNPMGMASRPMMGMPPITSPAPNPVAMGWVVTPDLLDKYNKYYADRPKDMMGRVQGKECALFLEASGLDRPTIARVLELSDIDHDNSFDQEEFALAMHLALCISRRKMPVPSKLDDYLIPPTKRVLLAMRPPM